MRSTGHRGGRVNAQPAQPAQSATCLGTAGLLTAATAAGGGRSDKHSVRTHHITRTPPSPQTPAKVTFILVERREQLLDPLRHLHRDPLFWGNLFFFCSTIISKQTTEHLRPRRLIDDPL